MHKFLKLISLVFLVVFGQAVLDEDHIDPHEDYHDLLPSDDREHDYYEDHQNENNDHLTSPDPWSLHLTTESDVYEEPVIGELDEDKISRMLEELSNRIPAEHHDEPYYDEDIDYEIEDRIVRYAMHNHHEEI